MEHLIARCISANRWFGWGFDRTFLFAMDELCQKDEKPPYDDFFTNVTGC